VESGKIAVVFIKIVLQQSEILNNGVRLSPVVVSPLQTCSVSVIDRLPARQGQAPRPS